MKSEFESQCMEVKVLIKGKIYYINGEHEVVIVMG